MSGGSTGASLYLESSNRQYPLTTGQSWTIGRSDRCAVVLDSRSVSRLHALIQRFETGEYFLIDLGSRNGSFANGRRVTIPMPLRNGDRMAFGDQQLEFRLPPTSTITPGQIDDPRNAPTTSLVTHMSATIVVVDIRDFTPLARSVSEDLLSQTIGTWFLRVGRIAQELGSYAQKYIGDAVMAVWVHNRDQSGPGVGVQDEILRALQAVSRIEHATGELSRTLPLPGPLRIGAGVNTGTVIIGDSELTALGDTVNTAFRLEEATKIMGLGVAIGPRTHKLLSLPPQFVLSFDRREVPMKGYEGMHAAYGISFEALDRLLKECKPN